MEANAGVIHRKAREVTRPRKLTAEDTEERGGKSELLPLRSSVSSAVNPSHNAVGHRATLARLVLAVCLCTN